MQYTGKQCKLAHKLPDGSRVQTIQQHLEGTARRAQEFARPFGGGSQARLAGLLHDIGKYSDAFQRRLEGGMPVDHSTAGAQIACQRQHPEVAFAVAGHHGGLPDGGSALDGQESGTLLGRTKRKVEPFEEWSKEITLPAANRPDWLKDGFTTAFYIRMLYSCLVDADYLDTEEFMEHGPVDRGVQIPLEELKQRLLAFVNPWWQPKTAINAQRCKILRRCLEEGAAQQPGFFSLTVPTGGGKTVASLAFALAHGAAWGKRRVVYVIPYTSIVDQTAQVFRQVLGEQAVLEHHSGSNAIVPEQGTEPVSPQQRVRCLATENWDMPVVVTTAVQFFESLFANRSSRCRKLHNLADSVIVLDEAQTLPVPYLRPCLAALAQLARHYGATVVFCTATQPAVEPLLRELAPELPLRELMQDPKGLYQTFRRTTLKRAGLCTEGELLQQLVNQPQVLCVVNRRATAQRLYQQLPQEGSYCLTTLICPAHRKALLGEIRARLREGKPCRVISTSLIEAGVDVDFPAVWRQRAGLDSIAQTAGRCNREGKRSPEDSIVTVFELEGEKPLALLRAQMDAGKRILQDAPDPLDLDSIGQYFSLLLTLKGEKALDAKEILDRFNQKRNGCVLPFAQIAQEFRLVESNTSTIYIPLPENRHLIELVQDGTANRSVYRALGQYGVEVYPQHLEQLLAVGAVEQLDAQSWLLTDDKRYCRATGLDLDVETGQAWMY